MTALAREHRTPAELTGLLEYIYQRAQSRYGPVHRGFLAVALLAMEAGERLRHR